MTAPEDRRHRLAEDLAATRSMTLSDARAAITKAKGYEWPPPNDAEMARRMGAQRRECESCGGQFVAPLPYPTSFVVMDVADDISDPCHWHCWAHSCWRAVTH